MGKKLYGDKWQIGRSLGEGGQAHTFVVTDITGAHEGEFILKRLKNVNRLDRFEAEVQAIAALKHDNVLRLVDYDLTSDPPYLVSEYCREGSIENHRDRWYGTPVEALRMFAAICDGVAAGHLNYPPIIHRDIKPANILLRSPAGPPVVADYGICHIVGGERVTLTDEAAGSRNFIAPELADGRAAAVFPWSDVYSLGKVLYWMLSGGRIFARERHRDEEHNLVGHEGERPDYEHINRFLDRMIVEDPTKRYPNARQAADAARGVADFIARGAPPMGTSFRLPCTFCKVGRYWVEKLDTPQQRENFGLHPNGGGFRWRGLVCDQCGHVQVFNVDKAGQRDNWWR